MSEEKPKKNSNWRRKAAIGTVAVTGGVGGGIALSEAIDGTPSQIIALANEVKHPSFVFPDAEILNTAKMTLGGADAMTQYGITLTEDGKIDWNDKGNHPRLKKAIADRIASSQKDVVDKGFVDKWVAQDFIDGLTKLDTLVDKQFGVTTAASPAR